MRLQRIKGCLHFKVYTDAHVLYVKTKSWVMSIKSDYNVSHNCFDEFTGLIKEACPDGNSLPSNFSEVKKIVGKLGLTAEKIDCCPNGCMLYYKDDLGLRDCKFCHHPRYKIKRSKKAKGKEVPYARMHYLPIIPRLQRLFASRSSAEHMRWHNENVRQPGVMCHPSDGEAWKHFNGIHPEFASEPRNVRLGLCADGFAPYSLSAKSYSCWPVILTPYNLPPELCMTTPYMFLTCIIPGPNNPKSKIDVYLQPLIDDLKTLWEGVVTYDISRKENFLMKAALMWTINDFPAYGMLSGWSTHGTLACPICMHQTKSFRLKKGGKATWFDCHRRFLPPDHPFRRNKQSFLKNKVENDPPPIKFSGETVAHLVSQLPKVYEMSSFKISGFGETHNWTKQSIFWELPYWKTSLLRHNLILGVTIVARRRLAKILGREPTIDELFLFTHEKKSSGEISGDKWVDKRSEDAYEKFKKKKEDLKLTENSTDAPRSTAEGTEGDGVGIKEQPSQAIDEVEVWRESVGLTKKGKVYGLGLHASTLRESSSGSQKSTDTSRQQSVPVVDTPEFKAAVAEVTSKLEVVQKASEHKDKELQRLKRENKRLKQKVDILFEKLNMVPLQGSESEDDEDE